MGHCIGSFLFSQTQCDNLRERLGKKEPDQHLWSQLENLLNDYSAEIGWDYYDWHPAVGVVLDTGEAARPPGEDPWAHWADLCKRVGEPPTFDSVRFYMMQKVLDSIMWHMLQDAAEATELGWQTPASLRKCLRARYSPKALTTLEQEIRLRLPEFIRACARSPVMRCGESIEEIETEADGIMYTAAVLGHFTSCRVTPFSENLVAPYNYTCFDITNGQEGPYGILLMDVPT